MTRLAMLPPDRYPCLVEAAAPMTSLDDPDFHYRLGIDLFIHGVQAMAERGQPHNHHGQGLAPGW